MLRPNQSSRQKDTEILNTGATHKQASFLNSAHEIPYLESDSSSKTGWELDKIRRV